MDDFSQFYCPHALADGTFGLGGIRWSSPQQCYLHRLRTTGNTKTATYLATADWQWIKKK